MWSQRQQGQKSPDRRKEEDLASGGLGAKTLSGSPSPNWHKGHLCTRSPYLESSLELCLLALPFLVPLSVLPLTCPPVGENGVMGLLCYW